MAKKTYLCAAIALSAAITVSGCSQAAPKADPSSISVSKQLLTYTVTLPKSMLGDISKKDIEKSAKKNGYTSATLNKDGSVTYVMPAAVHDRAMAEMLKSTDTYIAKTIQTSDGAITSISHDSGLEQFKVEVDKEKYSGSLSVGFVGMGLAISAGFYQMFDGKTNDEMSVDVEFVDAATQKVLDSQHFPQD